MSSLALYGRDYAAAAANGLDPLRYKYRFLAEGDSWMDRSSVATGSLPEFLAKAMDAGGDEVLIVNLSMFGHTMRHIGEMVQGEFAGWIDFWNFDGILLSAAGNDFIDAARDEAPGQGLLRDMAGQPLPAQGYDCVKQDAVASLVTGYLDPNFQVLYDAVRNSAKNAATPIFLNLYDTPVARDAPAPPGKTAWLFEAYRKNAIDPSLWPDLTDGIFNDVQMAITGWQKDRTGVHLVPTDGTLKPALPGDKGDSGDWINEIHPNAKGWKKLAKVWREAILGVI